MTREDLVDKFHSYFRSKDYDSKSLKSLIKKAEKKLEQENLSDDERMYYEALIEVATELYDMEVRFEESAEDWFDDWTGGGDGIPSDWE